MERVSYEHVQRIRELLQAGAYAGLDEFLEPMHPADVAEILPELEQPDQVTLLKYLGTERAASVLTEVDDHSGQTLLLLLSDREIVALLEEMRSDDAADLMSTLSPEKTEAVGELMEDADRDQLVALMEYDEDSAGGIMEVENVVVQDDETIRDAIRVVRAQEDDVEHLQKVFVVDADNRLVGVVNVLDLLLRSRSTPVRDIMKTNVISVPVDMDQEDVAGLFGKYDELTLPVVDSSNRLVGRITVDDIIDVLEEEASEDIARLAGTTEDEIGEPSPIKTSRARLPWLVFSVLGQLITASVLNRYETTIGELAVLVLFIPLIVGTAGSVGMQAAVVVVRELALGQIDLRRLGDRVGRELLVAFLNGIVLGLILFGAVYLWFSDAPLGVLLWLALMAVIIVAAFVGASIPLLMNRLKIDPAIATGPFITVLNDIVGLAIYLSLANIYLAKFS